MFIRRKMIHQTAIIHKNAKVGPNVEIGPYCVIGEHVSLGEGTKLHPHVVIDGYTAVGKNNEFFPGCVVGFQGQDLKFKGEVSYLEIGNGGIFREFVTIHRATGEGNKTIIGNKVFFMANAHVGHNSVIGDQVTLVNGAGVGGHVTIEEKAFVSAYVPIHQFSRIGMYAMVGLGSHIDKDVPPYMLGAGHPFEVQYFNKVGLARAGIKEDGFAEIKDIFKITFRSGLNTEQAVERIRNEIPNGKFAPHFLAFIKSSKRGIYKGRDK